MRHHRWLVGACAVVLAAALGHPATTRAETQPLDLGRSKLTVLVYKSGLFSAFADDHIIDAPIASGTISEDVPLSVQMAVRTATMKVLDPKQPADRRAEVQKRMLGAEVLDVDKYPDITFASTTIVPAGADKWTVTGELSIHGHMRSITFPVDHQNGVYRGTVAIRQRDFGIDPISIAGGTVKVKDELKIQFEIVAGSAAR